MRNKPNLIEFTQFIPKSTKKIQKNRKSKIYVSVIDYLQGIIVVWLNENTVFRPDNDAY